MIPHSPPEPLAVPVAPIEVLYAVAPRDPACVPPRYLGREPVPFSPAWRLWFHRWLRHDPSEAMSYLTYCAVQDTEGLKDARDVR